MRAHDDVVGALSEAQSLGMIGPGSVVAAVEHAWWFVEALRSLVPGSAVIDLGSGGGLPGLVIASARPDVRVVLVERREKRSDFLQRMVRRLGFEHVEVRHTDVDGVIADVQHRGDRFDAVTARGFGPPESTLRRGVRLIRPGGVIVISEPPEGDRWRTQLLDELGVRTARVGAVRCFELAVTQHPEGGSTPPSADL